MWQRVHAASIDVEARFWLDPEIRLAKGTSAVEFTNISAHGIWLLVRERELFVSEEDCPWSREQPVKSIVKVEEQFSGHFYWPDIDADLTTETIEHPERVPLRAIGA